MNNIARYQLLLKAARALGQAAKLDELLEQILQEAKEVLNCQACSIFLPDQTTGELIIHSAYGEKAPLLSAMRIPKGAGIAGAVFASKASLRIDDVQNDPRHYNRVDSTTGFVTRCLLTVPLLKSDNQCLGVIQAINPQDRLTFDDEDQTAFEAFAGLIVSALLRLEDQKRELEEVQAKQELELAKEIQLSFIPPSYTRLEPCAIHLYYAPAKVIGGDFCFIHTVKPHQFLIGLGDVSGKGIPASLNMARATATIKSLASHLKDDLGAWVSYLNTHLSADLYAGRFIGLTFLLADALRQTLQICTAGQYAPFHTNGKLWKRVSPPRQFPVGIMPYFEYRAQTFPLERGDSWLLFSDGIAEARNSQDEEFGEERFLNSLPTNVTAATIFEQALQSWKNFTAGTPPHDDATLLLLDWRGNPPASQLQIECQPSTLAEIRQFVESWAQFVGYDDITTGHVVLACDEAITNIFRHAYNKKGGPLTITVALEQDYLTFCLKDHGQPVDPQKIIGRSLDQLRPGGLGTVVLSKVFDKVAYHPHTHGTMLELKKKLPFYSIKEYS